MFNLRSREAEILVKEDGKVAASTLPFDQASSQTAFETATFGMG